MPASEEVTWVLGPYVLPDFEAAAGGAVLAIDESERPLCAGIAEMAWATGTERGLFDEPGKRPFYVVTTAAFHFGVLLKKGGMFSKAASTNRSIPRMLVSGFN